MYVYVRTCEYTAKHIDMCVFTCFTYVFTSFMHLCSYLLCHTLFLASRVKGYLVLGLGASGGGSTAGKENEVRRL